MKNFIITALFTVLVSLMYTGIAYMLPQQPEIPPPEVELGSNIGPEQLAETGVKVFENQCKQCHKLGESSRAPDLAGVGMRAEDRAEERGVGYTAVDYLVESLCQPNAYVVEPFGRGGMTPQQDVLSGGQLLAVVAYLQTLGGEASVKGTDVKPLERFGCLTGASAKGGAAKAAKKAAPVGKPEEIFANFGCSTCHAIEDDSRKSGPSLWDAGKRLTKGAIYESILAPDKVIAKGDPPYGQGLMKKSLDGNKFYEQMTPADYQALVDWLASHKGGQE